MYVPGTLIVQTGTSVDFQQRSGTPSGAPFAGRLQLALYAT
jgi:hypothetical protein